MKWVEGKTITCPHCGHQEDNFTHGETGYVHHGCRCEVCTAANRRRSARGQRDRAARLAADPTLAPHGSTSTYDNWLCRCPDCKAAKSVQNAETHRRRAERAS